MGALIGGGYGPLLEFRNGQVGQLFVVLMGKAGGIGGGDVGYSALHFVIKKIVVNVSRQDI